MDLQQFVNHFSGMTCILSVEKKEDGSCGEIRTALKTADKRMYLDKEAYYRNHPELKR